VSFTDKGHDGFAPIFAYIGTEGHMLDTDVAPGQWEHYVLREDGVQVPVGAVIAAGLKEAGAVQACFVELWHGCVLVDESLTSVGVDQTSVSSCETLFWTASSSAVSTPHAERTRPPFEGEIPKSHSKIEFLLKSWEIVDGIPVWMPTASGPPARGAALTSIHISIPEGDIHRSRGQGAFKPRRPRFSYNG